MANGQQINSHTHRSADADTEAEQAMAEERIRRLMQMQMVSLISQRDLSALNVLTNSRRTWVLGDASTSPQWTNHLSSIMLLWHN